MRITLDDLSRLLYMQGPMRRFTQDSPVLPEVWLAYAQSGRRQDVLLTPYQDYGEQSVSPAAKLAEGLYKRLMAHEAGSGDAAGIAYHQATVAARLTFEELVRCVLPMSDWWIQRVRDRGLAEIGGMHSKLAQEIVRTYLGEVIDLPTTIGPDILWLLRVVGTIQLIVQTRQILEQKKCRTQHEDKLWKSVWPPLSPEWEEDRSDEEVSKHFDQVVEAGAAIFEGMVPEPDLTRLVHLVSNNREARASLFHSRMAIKADAAQRVFQLSCATLNWAILDTGIDARHPAFRVRDANSRDQSLPSSMDSWGHQSRVRATYDFTRIRDLLCTDEEAVERLPQAVRQRLACNPEIRGVLKASLLRGREIDWSLVRPLIEVSHDENYVVPSHEHGTHVAGILAADWRLEDLPQPGELQKPLLGICPDINLYDFRVLDEKGQGDEFSVMAALQFVRYLNAHKEFLLIHGVNLSLSIRHEVRNYACGRTPVCDECERVVGAGVLVVAAAGNDGYEFKTPWRDREGYCSISITDPGNSEEVLTVGATHRDLPHRYGVSYFSSRGPTGDGRSKPDLVAPGEKITSCTPGGSLKTLDGTSMAVPHVSGAAALLMARHYEMIGRPRKVKEILCQTATDLGRERYFQGSGMLDVLRAIQSI